MWSSCSRKRERLKDRQRSQIQQARARRCGRCSKGLSNTNRARPQEGDCCQHQTAAQRGGLKGLQQRERPCIGIRPRVGRGQAVAPQNGRGGPEAARQAGAREAGDEQQWQQRPSVRPADGSLAATRAAHFAQALLARGARPQEGQADALAAANDAAGGQRPAQFAADVNLPGKQQRGHQSQGLAPAGPGGAVRERSRPLASKPGAATGRATQALLKLGGRRNLQLPGGISPTTAAGAPPGQRGLAARPQPALRAVERERAPRAGGRQPGAPAWAWGKRAPARSSAGAARGRLQP